MNKPVIAGIAAGALLAGFVVFGPLGQINLGVQAQPTGVTKKVTLIADEAEVQVAPDNALHPGGITYRAMVFNGTIPGPVFAVDQGDTVEMTLRNEGEVIHSIDFHAAIGPSKVLSGNVAPGGNKTWTFDTPNAGFFFYHCGSDGLNGVWEHIANGMYGGVVVHPVNEKPAKEFYLSFGEIYNAADNGVFEGTNGTVGTFDIGKFLAQDPDLILTNGMAHKYVPAIGEQAKLVLNPELNQEMGDGNMTNFLKVKPGELTRWYILAPGPNDGVAFHFISGQIDVKDGSIKNRYGTQLMNDETWWVPAGSGSVIESVFPEKGIYVGLDHNMAHVVKGGAFVVVATPDSTDDDQPEGTWVPPKGSAEVSGPSMVTGGNVTGGNVTGGNVTGGNVTGGNVTGGNVTGGNVTGGNMTAAPNATAP
jgi:nitrite reductase (NO-forming)